MPNNYLSVLYKHIIQVENKNVGLKGGGGGGTNIPIKKWGGGHMPPLAPPLSTPVRLCHFKCPIKIKLTQRCQLVRFTRKPCGFLRFARAYGHTMQSLRIFMIFADSNLQLFHASYSNYWQFAMTPDILCEHESK